MISGAIIDGRYRYRLYREWGGGRRICFIMLNPSTADAQQDDPTIRRCIGFAKALDGGSLEVVNLFALRATNPTALAQDFDPIGPGNDKHIQQAVQMADAVICAWGTTPFASRRSADVLTMVRAAGVRPMCLRKTMNGQPAHPLYLPAALVPVLLD